MTMTASVGRSLNPLSSSVSGGLIPSGNQIVNVAKWADPLEPRRTPVLSRIKVGAAVDQVETKWGQSYHAPVSGNLAGGITNNATSITVAAGQGKLFQQWNVVEIIDYVPNSTRLDYSTREEVILQGVPDGTDTLTSVLRGNGSGIGVAHAAGAYWALCGTALPYNTDFPLSPFVRGDQLLNYPQRFAGMVSSDVAARNTPTYETKGDPFLKDLKNETMKQKWYLERAVVSGQRLQGNAATSAIPHKLGGIDFFITNYSGRVQNLTGRTLSAYDLEEVLYDMFVDIDDGGAKTMLMGPGTARIFDALINPIRHATAVDTKLNLVTKIIEFRFGALEIEATQHLPEGIILFVDFKDFELRPYKGCSWSTKQIATKGAYDQTAIWGDYTLVVDRVQRMGKVHNFDTNLANYPRRELF